MTLLRILYSPVWGGWLFLAASAEGRHVGGPFKTPSAAVAGSALLVPPWDVLDIGPARADDNVADLAKLVTLRRGT